MDCNLLLESSRVFSKKFISLLRLGAKCYCAVSKNGMFLEKIWTKKFAEKKVSEKLTSEIVCNPKFWTSKIALNELALNCFFSFLINMINTVLCVAVDVTLAIIVSKNNVFSLGYNLALILFQQSFHFVVYPLTLILCSWDQSNSAGALVSQIFPQILKT